MKTQIIGVLGLGIFGQTIATELSVFGQDVIALDNNSTTIDFLADQVTKAAVGDITDIDFLRSAGIDTCDTVIIATGEHLESSALALLQCKKLGITNIIAKLQITIMRKSFTEWEPIWSSLLSVAQQKTWLQIYFAITFQVFFI